MYGWLENIFNIFILNFFFFHFLLSYVFVPDVCTSSCRQKIKSTLSLCHRQWPNWSLACEQYNQTNKSNWNWNKNQQITTTTTKLFKNRFLSWKSQSLNILVFVFIHVARGICSMIFHFFSSSCHNLPVNGSKQ